MGEHGLLFVTGASGFLGRAIVRAARERGWRVRAFAHEWPARVEGIECLTGSVVDEQAVRLALDGASHVIHAAGLAHQFTPVPDERFFQVNTRGTAVVARAAAELRVSRFVFISSVSVYGGGRGLIDERRACAPRDAYAKSKLAAEREIQQLVDRTGLSAIVLRPVTLYGEGDPGNVRRLIRALDRRRFVSIGPGANLKSLLHRDDAARACVETVSALPGREGVYNLADAPSSMRAIVVAICAALGRRAPRLHVPAPAARVAVATLEPLLRRSGRSMALGAMLDKWLGDDAYDGTLFGQTFGCQPRVPLDQGLAREVRWLRAGAPAVP
jgi:nucleoside-diphosphate-sugar epimerase